jgi:vitamin B12 transporter
MPHFKTTAVLTAGLTLIPLAALAQPADDAVVSEAVVTASRGTEPLRASLLGASVTVITPQQMEDRQVRIVSDVLRDVPGVSIGRTGAVGNLTQVRIRGAEANHTLTLIDGIEASDPFQGEFNYAALTADDAVRIEVLRGQQSALYGSDAIGGVIHYITLTGAEAPGVRLRSEAGSFNTWQSSARIAGAPGDFDYAVTGGYLTTAGFPTATHGARDIGAQIGSAGVKLGWQAGDRLKLKAVGRYASTVADENSESYFDATNNVSRFEVVDTPGKHTNSEALYGLASAQLDLAGGRWINVVSIQGAAGERDTFLGSTRSAGDKGSRGKASLESTWRFGGALEQQLTAALDLERESFQNTAPPSLFAPDTTRRHIDNVGAVLEYEAVMGDRLGFGAALRHDDNDRFRNADTYRVQASYRLKQDLRVRGAAGSGIRNPSQTELFGFNAGLFPFVGNPDLKPERSEGWEVGLEQRLLDGRAIVGVTWFDSTLKDEIFTDFAAFPSTARNRTTDSHQKGVEVEGHAAFGRGWTADLAYALLDADEDGAREIRRPKHSGSLNLSWRDMDGRGGVGLTARYNGRAVDTDFATFTNVVHDAFVLVNLAGDIRLTRQVKAFARVENLLDEDYQEVFGYRTAPRAAYAGLSARF